MRQPPFPAFPDPRRKAMPAPPRMTMPAPPRLTTPAPPRMTMPAPPRTAHEHAAHRPDRSVESFSSGSRRGGAGRERASAAGRRPRLVILREPFFRERVGFLSDAGRPAARSTRNLRAREGSGTSRRGPGMGETPGTGPGGAPAGPPRSSKWSPRSSGRPQRPIPPWSAFATGSDKRSRRGSRGGAVVRFGELHDVGVGAGTRAEGGRRPGGCPVRPCRPRGSTAHTARTPL